MPGDKLFLYSDGVTEAKDDQGTLFGEKRLKTILSGSASIEEQPLVLDFLKNVLEEGGISQKDTRQILTAANEVLSNICYYSGVAEVTLPVK